MIQFRLATLVRIFVLTAFLVTAVQIPASAEWINFKVMNHTGYTIKELYMTTSTQKWGKNVLNKPLNNGYYITQRYSTDLSMTFSVKIVFPDGSYRYWSGNNRQNLRGARGITFFRDGNQIMLQKDY